MSDIAYEYGESFEVRAVSSSMTPMPIRVTEWHALPSQWKHLLPVSPHSKVRYFCMYCLCQMVGEAEACGHCGAPTRDRYVEVNNVVSV